MPKLAPVRGIRISIALLVLIALPMGAAHAGEEVDEATLELGREVFLETAQPACGICHTLADAGTTGTIAPSLDTLRPDVETVRNALIEGPEAMPTYADTLTDEEIDAVAEYVAAIAGTQ